MCLHSMGQINMDRLTTGFQAILVKIDFQEANYGLTSLGYVFHANSSASKSFTNMLELEILRKCLTSGIFHTKILNCLYLANARSSRLHTRPADRECKNTRFCLFLRAFFPTNGCARWPGVAPHGSDFFWSQIDFQLKIGQMTSNCVNRMGHTFQRSGCRRFAIAHCL